MITLPLKSSRFTVWMGEVGRDRTGEMYKYIGEVMKKYHGLQRGESWENQG